MKHCSKCGSDRDDSEFNKNKRSADGLCVWCKLCTVEYQIKYREKNADTLLNNKKYKYNTDKDKFINRVRNHRNINRDSINKRRRELYATKNRDKILGRAKIYSKNNRDKINLYLKKRKSSLPTVKMAHNLRGRIYEALQRSGNRKKYKSEEILGTNIKLVKDYIGAMFSIGMSWDNYGEWHIDHIIPLSSAKTEHELILLCHYTNLQPLWSQDNLRKGAKIISIKKIA